MNTTAGLVSSYAWHFGDGSGSSAATNPVYTYTIPGTYAVTLTAHGPGGSSTYTAYVTVLQPPPVASFYANPPLGAAPLIIAFGNTSTGTITAYSWSFGDGVGSSTQTNPAYTYTVPGSYLVTLTVFGPGGSSTASVLIYAYAPPTPTPTPTRRPTRTPTPTPTSTATPTDTPGAVSDLVVSKSASDPAPPEGTTVTFTVTVTNNGPDTASGVEIADNLPLGVTFVTANPTLGSYTGGVWTVGTLADGASAALDLMVSVNSGTAGNTITNTATITASDQTDPDPANDVASATIIPVPPLPGPAADLIVSKTVDIPNPAEGASVTFTVTVINNGPDAASGVEITDNLPVGVTLVVANPSQGSYTGGVWTVGTLADGASAALDLTVSVDAGTAGNTITNTATINASDQTDPDPANNAASAAIIPVLPSIPTANLTITKTVDNPSPAEGNTISYRVQVTNNGPDNADGIQVTDILPAGTSYAGQGGPGSYDPVTGIWAISTTLSAGQSVQKRIDVHVEPGTAGTTVTNTAAITALNQTDPDPANNSTSAAFHVTGTDLSMSKSVDNPAPAEGGTITYTVTLTNNGPDDAPPGVQVTDSLPAGLVYSSSLPSQGTYDNLDRALGRGIAGGEQQRHAEHHRADRAGQRRQHHPEHGDDHAPLPFRIPPAATTAPPSTLRLPPG